jgi:transposase InsO family protein
LRRVECSDFRLPVVIYTSGDGVLRPPVESAQYASELHRDLLKEHGFVGSMSRRGNPYDNAQAESIMKTLKVEDAYLMEYETFEDVAIGVP